MFSKNVFGIPSVKLGLQKNLPLCPNWVGGGQAGFKLRFFHLLGDLGQVILNLTLPITTSLRWRQKYQVLGIQFLKYSNQIWGGVVWFLTPDPVSVWPGASICLRDIQVYGNRNTKRKTQCSIMTPINQYFQSTSKILESQALSRENVLSKFLKH